MLCGLTKTISHKIQWDTELGRKATYLQGTNELPKQSKG